jgi:acetyl-CoA carboxylase carboxyltransferase component
MNEKLNELNRRREMGRAMGGADSIAFQHGRGKLTVRERIAALADDGQFDEIGVLAGAPAWDGNALESIVPSNTVIGSARIKGRRVFINGGDFTIRGGAADGGTAGKAQFGERYAFESRMPYIRLIDASGGSVRTFEDIGMTYTPGGRVVKGVELMQMVPVVSAVLGSVAGLPAVNAALCHFNVMVKDTTQVYVGGPPVVKAALGVDITKEELGNEKVQVNTSGVIQNLAKSEAEAFDMIRRFLSYMPQNVWEMPPRAEISEKSGADADELADFIPENPRKIYDVHKMLNLILDHDSFFEIQPRYGRSRITGLARIDGYPVAVMANNPRFHGGTLNSEAIAKVRRLIQLADVFHLPLVYFCDEPGFMVGLEEEKKGILREGAALAAVNQMSKMPFFTVITRQAFGVAGGLSYRPHGLYRRLAWPSASWGSMHIQGGVSAAYRREIQAADDPAAKQAEIEARLEELASPLRTAHAFNVEDIIDPRDTRQHLINFVEDAQHVLQSQLGETARNVYLP